MTTKPLRKMGMKSVADIAATALDSPSNAPAPGRAPASTATPAEREERLAVMIPSLVMDQLKMDAVKRREPMRAIVLRALAAYGYEVPAELMTDRRVEANRGRAGKGR